MQLACSVLPLCAAQGCSRAWQRAGGRPPARCRCKRSAHGFDEAVPLCCGAPDFNAQERFLRQPDLACLKCLLCAARRGVRSVCGWTHDGVAVVPAVRYSSRHATSHGAADAGAEGSPSHCRRGDLSACMLVPRTPPSALSAHVHAWMRLCSRSEGAHGAACSCLCPEAGQLRRARCLSCERRELELAACPTRSPQAARGSVMQRQDAGAGPSESMWARQRSATWPAAARAPQRVAPVASPTRSFGIKICFCASRSV